MSRGKSFLVGAIISGTVSAAVVLLNTPASGSEIRNRVKKRGVEWKDMFDNISEDALRLKDQISKTSKEGVALINELTHEMKASVEEWKAATEPHQDNIQEYLGEIQESVKDLENKLKKE